MEFRRRVKLALIRFGLKRERLYPFYIKYALNHRLKRLKQQGIVSSFDVKTKRLNRLHYLVQVDLDVNQSRRR